MKAFEILKIAVFLIISSAILTTCTYPRFSPEARRIRASIKELKLSPINSAVLEPYQYCSIVSSPKTITDQATLVALSNALSDLPTFFPNHPNVTRAVTIRMKIRNGEIIGHLKESSNDWTWFQVETRLGYIDYVVPINRRIFELLDPHGQSRCT